MSEWSIPVVRGCGRRIESGIYFDLGLSRYGRPIEDFLIDPPILADLEAMGVSPRGVSLVERNGVWHIADWVGSENYPNVADFVEEVRRFGLSRRLPKTLDFSKITKDSRILLIHARAFIHNIPDYIDGYLAERSQAQAQQMQSVGLLPLADDAVSGGLVSTDAVLGGQDRVVRSLARLNELGISYWLCPNHYGYHEQENLLFESDRSKRMCIGVWLNDIEDGKEVDVIDGMVVRTMPSFSYYAHKRPTRVKPKYSPAIFASFPCSGLAVVRSHDGSHTQALANAQKAGVEVVEVDE